VMVVNITYVMALRYASVGLVAGRKGTLLKQSFCDESDERLF
jgi:hypothetical protein